MGKKCRQRKSLIFVRIVFQIYTNLKIDLGLLMGGNSLRLHGYVVQILRAVWFHWKYEVVISPGLPVMSYYTFDR